MSKVTITIGKQGEVLVKVSEKEQEQGEVRLLDAISKIAQPKPKKLKGGSNGS